LSILGPTGAGTGNQALAGLSLPLSEEERRWNRMSISKAEHLVPTVRIKKLA